MEGKRLVFCLTPGRSGTAYLARLLALCPGVVAEHEPEPNFVKYAREARQKPEVAARFWQEQKLPYIDSLECDAYAETSHLFNKGFVQPLLDLGRVPDVVLLRRPAREVALSYWRRDVVPGRTRDGLWYLLHPAAAEHMPFPHWEMATPYQLCFWYVLEMEKRMQAAAVAIDAAGGLLFETSTAELTRGKGFRDLVWTLDLPEPDWDEFARIKGRIVNPNPPGLAARYPTGDLDEQENQVLNDIAAGSPETDPDAPVKQRIDVAILQMGEVATNLVELELAMTQQRKVGIAITHASASPVANNRCQVAREFRINERKADWLLMLDDDTIPTGDFLDWADPRLDVVVFPAPCWKPSTHPDDPVVWNVKLLDSDEWTSDGRLPDPQNFPLVEVAGAGTGAMLIHRRVLEHPALRVPFMDRYDGDGAHVMGEDLDFCEKARAAGFRIWAALRHPCHHFKRVDLLNVAALVKNKERAALQRAIEGNGDALDT